MKRLLSIFVLTALILSLISCQNTTKTSESEEAKTHEVTDHRNLTVEVPNHIDRIAVCDVYPLPSILTVFCDSASKIVGMAPQSMAAAKNNLLGELYPEILNASTAFTDGTTVNLEELQKLNPDIVFYNAGNATLGDQLTNAGFCAIAVSAGKWQYDAFETLKGWITLFDQVLNTGNGVIDRVAKYEEEVTKLVNERIATLKEEEKQSVFFLFQYTETNMLTNGNPSFGSWWSKAIGANNVVTETTAQNSLKINMEQVNTWDPDVIFITNFTNATPESLYNNKIGSDDWSSVKAIKNKRVYKMPLGMYRSYTAGVDAPIALLWMAKACYPSLFEDIDITEKTVAYYKDIFGVTLTSEQANKIFIKQ